jgi:Zn-finger protein
MVSSHARKGQGSHRYPFFSNTECPYFPCHEGVPEGEFNCLFCYCPLYVLGPRCGGNFTYTASGHKDCSACTMTHRGDAGTELVKLHFGELSELARQKGEMQ